MVILWNCEKSLIWPYEITWSNGSFILNVYIVLVYPVLLSSCSPSFVLSLQLNSVSSFGTGCWGITAMISKLWLESCYSTWRTNSRKLGTRRSTISMNFCPFILLQKPTMTVVFLVPLFPTSLVDMSFSVVTAFQNLTAYKVMLPCT